MSREDVTLLAVWARTFSLCHLVAKGKFGNKDVRTPETPNKAHHNNTLASLGRNQLTTVVHRWLAIKQAILLLLGWHLQLFWAYNSQLYMRRAHSCTLNLGVWKFSKSKVSPKKKFARSGPCFSHCRLAHARAGMVHGAERFNDRALFQGRVLILCFCTELSTPWGLWSAI